MAIALKSRSNYKVWLCPYMLMVNAIEARLKPLSMPKQPWYASNKHK